VPSTAATTCCDIGCCTATLLVSLCQLNADRPPAHAPAASCLRSEIILVRAIRSGNKELERVYLPLSSLVTWAAVLACVLSICASLGVSLQPLLAVGGAGGIAAGFASQQLLLNLVAGVNIFLTRPFIAGDQVGVVAGVGEGREGSGVLGGRGGGLHRVLV
jgi:hypothetical protein